MASHVFVVDGRVRKARIQTTPSTYLSDILEQGCKKLNIDSNQFVLKHNGKSLDLSLTLRLSNLPSGAQLDLVQGSRSPTVVSVALQLADQRWVQKFPSNASLWQVLRVFETEQKLNFTERAVTPTTNSGAGRLFYEIPVLNYMGREFANLTDLQKTLAQIGLQSGSALLRLSFQQSEQPLEEAMQDISQYFKSEVPVESSKEAQETSEEPEQLQEAPSQSEKAIKEPEEASEEAEQAPKEAEEAPRDVEMTEAEPLESLPDVETMTKTPEPSLLTNDIPSPSILTVSSQTPMVEVPPSIAASPKPKAQTWPTGAPSVTVYKPTAANTPMAAAQPFRDSDYVPTMEHASTHQARLLQDSRNKRLPSDAELAAKEASKVAATAAVSSVQIRVRIPDGTQVQTKLERADANAKNLYETVREVSRAQTGWFIKYTNASGTFVLLKDDEKVDLIKDLGWKGSVLVYMMWEDHVATVVKNGPVLKQEAMSSAKNVSEILPSPVAEADEKSSGFLDGIGKALNLNKDKGKSSPADKEAKLKNLLGFGKKK